MFETTSDGNVTFTPNANYNGSFTIGYQMRDTDGLTGNATITVTIGEVNDKPTAEDENTSTDEDTEKEIDVSVLIGDVDILTNADELAVSIEAEDGPLHGTASVEGTTITYTPDQDFNGTDTITYTVTDLDGETDTGLLTITVNAVNDYPTAVDDTATTNEEEEIEIDALENDWDIDADEDLNKTPGATLTILSVGNGAHGMATTDGSSILYMPNDDYNGTDTLTYVLTDGRLTREAKIVITIRQVNDPIVAVDDVASTNDEDLVSIDVLANDTDVDTDRELNEDALRLRSDFVITTVSDPAHGTARIVSGKVEYTPEDRFAGTDSFNYTVSDGNGSTASASVQITVYSVNDPPETPVVSTPPAGDRSDRRGGTVNWSGFDIDGDVLAYRLEYLDGSIWKLVMDDLSDTTCDFTIPDSLKSTSGLKFRVNARDGEYTSEYGYSGAMIVDKDAPAGTVVTMRTADGKAYTEGT